METLQGKRIALISPENQLSELIKETLQSSEASIVSVTNGGEGLKLIEDGKPDLVILDVLMPGLTGYALLDILKAKGSTVPVLVISGITDMVDNLAAQNIAGLLIKPINMDKMLQHIDSIFKLQAASESIPESIEEIWKADERSFDDKSWPQTFTKGTPPRIQKLNSVSQKNPLEPSLSTSISQNGSVNEADDAHKPIVLVVDDEEDLRFMLTELLEAKGFRVITAANGQEGLNIARQEMPNAIVLDVMLPMMDGFQVCRLLKFNEKYRDIPIIMLTARQENTDRAIADAAGADSFISKPFDSEHLLGELNRLILKKKNQASA